MFSASKKNINKLNLGFRYKFGAGFKKKSGDDQIL